MQFCVYMVSEKAAASARTFEVMYSNDSSSDVDYSFVWDIKWKWAHISKLKNSRICYEACAFQIGFNFLKFAFSKTFENKHLIKTSGDSLKL